MAILTETQLREYSRVVRLSQSADSHVKGVRSSYPSVFLSHSHKDKDFVTDAKRFLGSHGVDVYVDWQDPGMPDGISAATATALRAKIESNKKFVLLATNNALSSKWVPWELGYADGLKGTEHIAVLAVKPDGKEWAGNEYVGVYPILEKEGVRLPGAATLTSLGAWLRR